LSISLLNPPYRTPIPLTPLHLVVVLVPQSTVIVQEQSLAFQFPLAGLRLKQMMDKLGFSH
jgi:hypothetical protein